MEDFRKKVERKSLHVSIDSSLRTREEITSSMDYVTKTLHSKGFLPRPCGELFKVSTQFDGDTIFSADRNYVPYFGIQGYGVCVNGYVEYGGEKKMWVGKRSLTKRTYPGLLDQLAAGGLPEGLTCRENVIKECWEEAGIIETISERALLASILSFERIEGFKFERYVLFCYDLLLPSSLTPQCKDGEMECFKLMSIPEVKASLENSTKFNPNSAIVATDFLIRHGIIQPEQPGYLSLVKSMREGRCL